MIYNRRISIAKGFATKTVLQNAYESEKPDCDDEHIYRLCPSLFDFRQRFTRVFLSLLIIVTNDFIAINNFRDKYGFVRDLLVKINSYFFAISEMKIDELSTSSRGLLVYIRGGYLFEINSGGFESLCIDMKIGHPKTLENGK